MLLLHEAGVREEQVTKSYHTTEDHGLFQLQKLRIENHDRAKKDDGYGFACNTNGY